MLALLLIGHYIVEYEQNGEDRAEYGAKILDKLSNGLRTKNLSNVNTVELRRFRRFYKTYSYFHNSLSSNSIGIRGTLPLELKKEKFSQWLNN